MILKRNIIPLLLALLSMTSCKITDSARTIGIEIMKPVDFALPGNLKTVAIFKGDLNKKHTNSFVFDTTFNYHELTDSCINGLSVFLENEADIQNVNNDSDSLNHKPLDPDLVNKSSRLFEITKADAIIFIDHFMIENGVFSYFDGTFRSRTDLSWTIKFRDESQAIFYNQTDTLFFSKSQYKDIQQKNKHSQQIYLEASEYLGKSFGTKLIPTWILDRRIYYHSIHPEMLKAEKYALNHDWLKAGEIWKKQTKNKNHKIAAKASFNMALACEMEGKHDLAIEWLTDPNYNWIKINNQHILICHSYLRVLSSRKDEIEKLEKQIRH